MIKKWLRSVIFVLLMIELPQVFACGGFFCQFIPINQAGEQIVFHKSA